MTIAKKVKLKILNMKEATIFTYNDFAELENFNAVSLALSRLVKDGFIKRLNKGKYFRPVQSKFGEKGPDESEIIRNLSSNGYISGGFAYNELGLSTQVPNEIIIIGSKYNRKMKIRNLSVRYQKRDIKLSNKKDSKYLQILDAIKDIKKIQGVGVNQSLKGLISLIENLNMAQQKLLISYALSYKPAVRALLGAILEKIKSKIFIDLEKTLNPLTSYNIGLDENVLPNKDRWRIK